MAFNFLHRKFARIPEKKRISANLCLPVAGLSSIVSFYKNYKGDLLEMRPVVIYNVEQLASEIAKHLKNRENPTQSTKDSEDKDKNSDGFPELA